VPYYLYIIERKISVKVIPRNRMRPRPRAGVLRVIRPEAEEERETLFDSGLAQGGRSSLKTGFLKSSFF